MFNKPKLSTQVNSSRLIWPVQVQAAEHIESLTAQSHHEQRQFQQDRHRQVWQGLHYQDHLIQPLCALSTLLSLQSNLILFSKHAHHSVWNQKCVKSYLSPSSIRDGSHLHWLDLISIAIFCKDNYPTSLWDRDLKHTILINQSRSSTTLSYFWMHGIFLLSPNLFYI